MIYYSFAFSIVLLLSFCFVGRLLSWQVRRLPSWG